MLMVREHSCCSFGEQAVVLCVMMMCKNDDVASFIFY